MLIDLLFIATAIVVTDGTSRAFGGTPMARLIFASLGLIAPFGVAASLLQAGTIDHPISVWAVWAAALLSAAVTVGGIFWSSENSSY